jgi:hypothetical protein
MTTQVTVNYGWIYPDPFTEEDTWATLLNQIFVDIDVDLKAVADAKQPLDADLTAFAALGATAGFIKKTGANAYSIDTADYQPLGNDLTALEALTGTGLARRTGAGTWELDVTAYATIAATQPLDGDLTAIAALGAGTLGLLRKTAANTWSIDDTDWATQAELDDAIKTTKNVNGSATAVTITPTLHAGKMLRAQTAGVNVFTIQPEATEAWPTGARVDIVRWSQPDSVEIVPGAGVTLNSADGKRKLRVAYSGGTLWRQASDVWVLFGDLAT